MPEPPAPVSRHLMSPELVSEFRAALELARAKQTGTQIPGEAEDPWSRHKNRDAFLIIEHQRRALAVRLHRADRRRSDCYRDLLVITQLIQLEYGHLAGRVGAGIPSLPEGPAGLGRDKPADWAQPWGVGPMFELRVAYTHYSHRRDRLARRLSAPTRASAAADAERELARIRTSSRFEWVAADGRLEVEHERVSDPPSEQRQAKPPRAPAAGEKKAAPEWRPRASLVPLAAAAVIAAVLAVAGIDDQLQTGAPLVSASAVSPTHVRATHRTLGPSRVTSRHAQATRGRTPHEGVHRSPPRKHHRSDAGALPQVAPPQHPTTRTASHKAAPTPVPVPAVSAPKPTPPKPSPPKSTPPKSTPPKSGPAPAPAPVPAPAPAPATPRASSPPST